MTNWLAFCNLKGFKASFELNIQSVKEKKAYYTIHIKEYYMSKNKL